MELTKGISDKDIIVELQAGIVLLKKERYDLRKKCADLSSDVAYWKDRVRKSCQKDIIAIPCQLSDVLGDLKQVNFPDKLETKKA